VTGVRCGFCSVAASDPGVTLILFFFPFPTPSGLDGSRFDGSYVRECVVSSSWTPVPTNL
jgi:hypothetical protein